MLDIVADFDMYYPNYEATYGNVFMHDYKSLFFLDFYSKLSNVEGNYKEVMRLRSLVLNGKRTQYNKEEWKAGNRLLTENQRKLIEVKKEEGYSKLEKAKQDSIDERYAKYLEEIHGDKERS